MGVGMRWPLVLELPWPPRTGNRTTRHARGGHYTAPEVVQYRAEVARLLERLRLSQLRLAGRYEVRLALQPPDSRSRDGDNLEKVLWDSLVKGGLLQDDSNKVLVNTIREWMAPEKPGRILLAIKEIK